MQLGISRRERQTLLKRLGGLFVIALHEMALADELEIFHTFIRRPLEQYEGLGVLGALIELVGELPLRRPGPEAQGE
jgi:hypothetical protein